jgi:hypothetical protein
MPIAVTTTSSNAEASEVKVTLIVLVEPTTISCDLYPIMDILKVSPLEACKVNEPFAAVCVPLVVPFIVTVAPEIGPLASETVPVMLCCA